MGVVNILEMSRMQCWKCELCRHDTREYEVEALMEVSALWKHDMQADIFNACEPCALLASVGNTFTLQGTNDFVFFSYVEI